MLKITVVLMVSCPRQTGTQKACANYWSFPWFLCCQVLIVSSYLWYSSLRSDGQPVFTVPTIRKDVINRMIALNGGDYNRFNQRELFTEVVLVWLAAVRVEDQASFKALLRLSVD